MIPHHRNARSGHSPSPEVARPERGPLDRTRGAISSAALPERALLNDPLHWRKRAQEMRALAAVADDDTKHRLAKIAEEYDRLAERAELRAR